MKVVLVFLLFFGLLATWAHCETIEDENIYVKVNDNFGHLESLRNKNTNQEFVNQTISDKILFKFALKNQLLTTTYTHVTNRNSLDSLSIEKIDENILKLNFEQFSGVLTVQCFIFLKEGNLKFNISIEENDPGWLKAVSFPILYLNSNLEEGISDSYLSPYHTGVLYKDIAEMKEVSWQHMYPGTCSVQFFSYYNRNNGIFVQSEDVEGFYKSFQFEKKGTGVTVTIINFPEEMKESYYLPYTISLSLVDKNGMNTTKLHWKHFADIYKKWAENNFKYPSVYERSDVPSFLFNVIASHETNALKKSLFFSTLNTYVQAYRDPPFAFTSSDEYLFTPMGSWCIDPQNDGGITWTGIHYFYPYNHSSPGKIFPSDPLVQSISDLKTIKVHTYLWLSGNRWDLYEINHDPTDTVLFNDTETFKKVGLKHIVIGEDGAGKFIDNFANGPNRTRRSAYISIGTPENNIMDTVITNQIKKGIRRGAKLMSLDQLVGGWSYFSWNLSRDGQVGISRYYHLRFISLLEEISSIIDYEGVRGDFGISLEETNELYIPYLQTHLIRENTNLEFGVPTIEDCKAKYVPIFSYVYSRNMITVSQYATIYNHWNGYSWWADSIRTMFSGAIPQSLIWCGESNCASIEKINSTMFNNFKKGLKMIDLSYRGCEHINGINKVSGLPEDIPIYQKADSSYFWYHLNEPVLFNTVKKNNGEISYMFYNRKEGSNYEISVKLSNFGKFSQNVKSYNIFKNNNTNRIKIFSDVTLETDIEQIFSISYLDIIIFDVSIEQCKVGWKGVDCEESSNTLYDSSLPLQSCWRKSYFVCLLFLYSMLFY